MAGFDIEELLDLNIALRWCMKCLCLLPKPYSQCYSDGYHLKCPICEVKYIPTSDYQYKDFTVFLEKKVGRPLKNIPDIIGHIKALASIARSVKSKNYSPLHGLFKALSISIGFVHFTSYGTTQMMIGALKMLSHRVPIRGIVSNPGESILSEITDFSEESPNLDIKIYDSGEFQYRDVPHQKLIVIDGILAFKGSTNLTQQAWRKAAQDFEVVDIVTNVDEVINFHNRYFSSVWGKMHPDIQEFIMTNTTYQFQQGIIDVSKKE